MIAEHRGAKHAAIHTGVESRPFQIHRIDGLAQHEIHAEVVPEVHALRAETDGLVLRARECCRTQVRATTFVVRIAEEGEVVRITREAYPMCSWCETLVSCRHFPVLADA
ncbi:MAG: hypothetical protein IPP83_05930 [Flavobacteriales bacterium]|nr:hypothetical protein [Flavobacteriales bacterium]